MIAMPLVQGGPQMELIIVKLLVVEIGAWVCGACFGNVAASTAI